MNKFNLCCTMEGSDKSHIIRMKDVVSVSARVCVEANDCTQNSCAFFLMNEVNRNFLKASCRKRLAFKISSKPCLHNHEPLFLQAVDLPFLKEQQDLNLNLSNADRPISHLFCVMTHQVTESYLFMLILHNKLKLSLLPRSKMRLKATDRLSFQLSLKVSQLTSVLAF